MENLSFCISSLCRYTAGRKQNERHKDKFWHRDNHCV